MATRVITHTSNSVLRSKDVFKSLTADTTLTAKDSGKTLLLDAVGEAITLPAVADGLNFKFLCTADIITSAWTIKAATKVISGSAEVAGAIVAAALEDVITFTHTVALIGDWVNIESDGSAWYVKGSAVEIGRASCRERV